MTDEFTKAREAAAQKLNLSNMRMGKEGPLANLANVRIALDSTPCFAGAFAYDVLRQDAVMVRDTPLGKAGPVKEHTLLMLAGWLQDRGLNVSPSICRDGLGAVAMVKSFHPVADYLRGLEWEGDSRIDEWLHAYTGADKNDYTRAVGAKWLISAVARAMNPGCKVDTMLVFEGEQGMGKSTAFQILGGEWFSDSLSAFDNKDSKQEATRWWIIEVAEMNAMSRSETSAIKAFLSRQVERFRLPYGRIVEDVPRSCVFAGTLNKVGGYLKDASGARRFWPIETKGKLQIESLLKDRDQLWAEAVHRYDEGEKWWLTSEENKVAIEEQEDRFDVDAWEDAISEKVAIWYANFKAEEKKLLEDEIIDTSAINEKLANHEISTQKIAAQVLNFDIAEIDRQTQTRIGNVMQRLGFAKTRIKVGKKRSYIYRKISNS